MLKLPRRIFPPHVSATAPLLAALLAATMWTAPAQASHSQAMFFEAPRDLVGVSHSTLSKSIRQLQWLGVKALRVELAWHDVAPGANNARKPIFNAADPANYNWGAYDPLLAEAQRLHWQVLLTVTSPVPRWAAAGHKDFVTSPDDRDFQEFMTAVGRHFGSAVSLYAIWNEPDHPAFLRPQFKSNGTPASPRIYRGLFQAGYSGLQAAGIAKPKVLMGETAPTGYDRVNVHKEGKGALLHDVAPLEFMRDALCLNRAYHKAGTCEALPIYGYAHHAYTIAAGPTYKPKGNDNVTIGVLYRLSSALDRAARAGAIPSHTPIFLTEFGVQSFPNRYLGVPLAKQAEFDALAEKIAWANPRVAAFSQYLLRDDRLGGKPGSSVHGGTIGFQTGLETYGGRRKPLYYGFPMPLVVSHSGHGYSLWGLVRPANGETKVKIQIQPRGSKRWRTLATVKTNSAGYWTLRSGASGAHWRVSWRSPGGVAYNGPAIGST